MNCPKCFNPNIPENANCCPSCGTVLEQPVQQFGRLCPSGKHTMDPSWTVCSFCKADSPATAAEPHRPTVSEAGRVNAAGLPVPHSPTLAAAPGGPRKTVAIGDLAALGLGGQPQVPQQPVEPPVQSKRRVTIMGFQPGMQNFPAPAAVPTPAPAGLQQQRIVAVLVSYSALLNPAGTVYAVREGRNKIGANPENEIAFLNDPTMSGWHASVTYRDGKYYLSAKDTMTGTYLDGVEVPPDSTTNLTNYATIRAGSTSFRFIMVAPVEAPVG